MVVEPDLRGVQKEYSLNASSMKKPLEYLAKGLGVSHTALWVLLLAALLVWLAMGAPMPQVGPAVPRQQPSQLVELWNSEFQNFTQVQNCPPQRGNFSVKLLQVSSRGSRKQFLVCKGGSRSDRDICLPG